ncbi:MAG: glycosyl hydrolase [Bacteroidota bacterium]
MLRKTLKIGTLISLCLIAVGLGEFIITFQLAKHKVAGNTPIIPQESLLTLSRLESLGGDSLSLAFQDSIYGAPDFDPTQFQAPAMQYRPWTRWWLPGNHLDRLELIREIQLFWENGFGGLEIYPTTAGLNPDLIGTETQGVFEVGTPAYFHNITMILEEVAKRNMQADLLLGSGTPTGGAHVSLNDNLQSLAFGESYVLGGKMVNIRLPDPRLPGSYLLAGLADPPYDHPHAEDWIHFYSDHKQLVALYATKYRKGDRTWPALDINDYLNLADDSTFLITSFVNDQDRLHWKAPKGYWKIIAVYAIPNGERPIFSAEHRPGYVLDPLDSSKVAAHHQWLIGNQVSLQRYMGNGFRGIFHDHFAFHTERHFGDEILDDFEQEHGYPLLPHLPILLQPGKNHSMMQAAEWKTFPEFTASEWDDRIRHDYALTISNRLIKDYLGTSMNWAKSNQLITRAQPYGAEIDIIKSAAYTHIPEAEQRYGGGSKLFLKLVSSGANWAHKPVISAETGGHKDLPGSMFPLQLKQAADKLFLSGINQLILHGSPYKTYLDEEKSQPWVPFSSPFLHSHNYSGNFSESSPFWKNQAGLNAYLSRCQYILQQGEAVMDVLIYYPFLGFPESFGNHPHQETYFQGALPGYHPISRTESSSLPFSAMEKETDPRNIWLKEVWPLIQILEESGINWGWVNDELLTEITTKGGSEIQLRGYTSQMVLVPSAPHIQLGAAENLIQISRKGARVVIYGSVPQHQPGFANRETNDRLIQSYFKELVSHRFIQQPEEFKNLLIGYPIRQPISFEGHLPYLRKIHRQTSDKGSWVFVSNTLDQDRFVSLRSDGSFSHYYWFNPQSGEIHPATINSDHVLNSLLGPYESNILLASHQPVVPDSLLKRRPIEQTDFWSHPSSKDHQLKRWDLIVNIDPVNQKGKKEYLNLQDSILQDWRDISPLKYSHSEGLYLHHLNVGDTLPHTRYILDLGHVMASADILINTIPIGTLSLPPFRLDISGHLVPGDNIIELWVKPPPRNHKIARGKAGDPLYENYSHDDSVLVEAGLIGPVHIWEVRKSLDSHLP